MSTPPAPTVWLARARGPIRAEPTSVDARRPPWPRRARIFLSLGRPPQRRRLSILPLSPVRRARARPKPAGLARLLLSPPARPRSILMAPFPAITTKSAPLLTSRTLRGLIVWTATKPTADPGGAYSGPGASAPTLAKAGTYILDTAAYQYGLDRLFLENTNEIPFNEVLSFNSVTAVENFFGVDSAEAKLATEFFSGYNGPWANMLFDRMPLGGGRARIYGANLGGLTLAQLQAINGTLSLTSEGYNFNASINLASATSFASAARLIQSALNAAQPTEARTMGSSIAPESAAFTGSIEGGLMVVTAVSKGQIAIGGILTSANGYSGQIIYQDSGTPGGVGVYNVWYGARVTASLSRPARRFQNPTGF